MLRYKDEKMSKDGLQDFHDDDDDEFGASFLCNGGQCPGNGQDTDSMATILNWTVKTVMKMRAVVMFDTMTIGLPSAIMSEGQFTLTDDTRTAPSSHRSRSSTILTNLLHPFEPPTNLSLTQNFVQCIIFTRTTLAIKAGTSLRAQNT